MLEPIVKKSWKGEHLFEIRTTGWYPHYDEYEQGEVIIEFDKDDLLELAEDIKEVLAIA